MSLMSKIDNMAQSYFPTFSGMFRKPSDKVPDTIPTDLLESIPKDVAISSQEILPKIRPEDGRKKPRTQKQIESYKKNFSKTPPFQEYLAQTILRYLRENLFFLNNI